MNIKQRVAKSLSIEYESRLMVFDRSRFSDVFDYCKTLAEAGFEVIRYDDIEAFRIRYEEHIKGAAGKIAVIVTSDIYVPYDIRKAFFEAEISVKKIFPNLHVEAITKHLADLDLISKSYDEYTDSKAEKATVAFLREKVFCRENIRQYHTALIADLRRLCGAARTYIDFIGIAKKKARIEYYAASVGDAPELSFADAAFERFISDEGYGALSAEMNTEFPTILPKALEFISGGKVALIVMDGLSLFDFEILRREFDGIEYEYNCIYALIPTTTAISRQALLSGKYPRELVSPFVLTREGKEFEEAAAGFGYSKQQILYARGYDVRYSSATKFAAIIINDIDDMIHGQRQGRHGQLRDTEFYAGKGKLQGLIRKLHGDGFTVYITADHGNTLCRGVGAVRGSGVETETKSKRAVIYKGFAGTTDMVAENATEYTSAFYLDKAYKYFICKHGVSFDDRGDEVITHGGASLDEVIVPFIRIKVVK